MRSLPTLKHVDASRHVGGRVIAFDFSVKYFGCSGKLRFFLGAEPFFTLQFVDPRVDQPASLFNEQRWELTVAVIREVAAGFVKFHATDMRTVDGFVAPLQQFVSQEFFEQDADTSPLGKP